MSRPVPDQRAAYRLLEPVEMRWADMDVYGHMNNAVHYQLFDTVVGRFELREGLLELGRSPTIFLVVASSCDYFDEIHLTDRITAGLGVARLGGSSVTYRISLFRNDAEGAAATGTFTHVNVDRQTRRPVPLDPSARAALDALRPSSSWS
jgi:acyl-CoA thioester hydrolase